MSFIYINPGYASMCETYSAVQGTDTAFNKNFAGACIGCSNIANVVLTNLPSGTKDVYMVGDWNLQNHMSIYNHESLSPKIGDSIARIDINTYKIYTTTGTSISTDGNHKQYVHFEFEFHSSTDASKAILKWTEDNVVLYNGTVDWLQKGDDITQISFGNSSDNRQQKICNIIISDQPIKKNTQIIQLTTSELENTMTKDGDNYVSTDSGQKLTESLATDSTVDQNGTINGICVSARNAYYDGEGLTKVKMDFLDASDNNMATQTFDLTPKSLTTTQSIYTNFVCNIPVKDISKYKVRYTSEP